jgi:tRNA pseudouridine38-40 synthase
MQVLSLRSAPVAPDELFHRLSDPPQAAWGICCARSARDGFHAQWSSVGKEYRYRLRLDPRADAPWEPYSWSPGEQPRLTAKKLDVARLAGALRVLEGTRDFSAFHQASSSRCLRTIHRAELVESASGVLDIRIRGDRFGRQQIRFMVGAAAAVAAGALAEEDFLRSIAEAAPLPGVKAPARGLVLWDVHYPAAVDPFDAEERLRAAALPADPPFTALTL